VIELQRNIALAALVSLSLAGCSSIKESIGATKQSPDETAVTARAPLVVPATFTLRPPQPGTPRPQDADPSLQAQRVLGGAPKDAPASQGEMELLSASGAAKANPNIRQELRAEVAQRAKGRSYADRILFARDREGHQGSKPAHREGKAGSREGKLRRLVRLVLRTGDAKRTLMGAEICPLRFSASLRIRNSPRGSHAD
jgi:hypothetical protein